MPGTVAVCFGASSLGRGLPGGLAISRVPGSIRRQLLRDALEQRGEDVVAIDPHVEVRRVQTLCWVMVSVWLAEHPPDDLLHLDPGIHALVDVGEVTERVVPAFLQAEVEDHVVEVAADKLVVVVLAALEQTEALGSRIRLVESERAVHGDVVRIDALLAGQVAPDENRWRLSLIEGSLGIVLLVGVALDDVGLTPLPVLAG